MILTTGIENASALTSGSAAAGVRGHSALAEGSSAIPAVGPIPACVTYARLGVPVVTRRREASTAFRNVGRGASTLRPAGLARSGFATIVRAVDGRRSVVRRSMTTRATSRLRAAAAVLTGEATEEARRSSIPSGEASRRIREAALGVATPANGAMATSPTVAARLVVVDPVPASRRNLPCGGLPSATAILGLASGRATTASGVKATGSGSQRNPVRASGVGGRLVRVAVRVTRSSGLAVLRD